MLDCPKIELGQITTTINGLWTGKKPPFKTVAVIRNTNFSKDCRLKMDDVAMIDVEERQFATRKLQVGDIIIEKSGGSDKQPVGRPVLFNIPDGDYSFSNFTSTLRVNDKTKVLPEYLQKFLYKFYLTGKTAEMQSKTTGLRNLDFNAYKRILVPVPSLEVQKQIVCELDTLSKIIDCKDVQIQDLDSLTLSLFHEMFGDPVINEKGWEVNTMKAVCSKLYAGGDVPKDRHSKEKSELYSIPILSNGKGDSALYGFTDSPRETSPAITISGRGTIGYSKIRWEPFFPIIRLIVAVPQPFVNIVFFQKHLSLMSFESTGGAIPQLTIPMIRDRKIILPPLDAQNDYAERVSMIEKQIEAISNSKMDIIDLLNSRMDYWFN